MGFASVDAVQRFGRRCRQADVQADLDAIIENGDAADQPGDGLFAFLEGRRDAAGGRREGSGWRISDRVDADVDMDLKRRRRLRADPAGLRRCGRRPERARFTENTGVVFIDHMGYILPP